MTMIINYYITINEMSLYNYNEKITVMIMS